jgi:hypothetical protein
MKRACPLGNFGPSDVLLRSDDCLANVPEGPVSFVLTHS